MVDKTEILTKVMLYVIEVVGNKHKELGMQATGEWLKALDYKIEGNIGYLVGLDYTEYLVKGREPGKRPPIKPIEKWVKAKFGISGGRGRSVAFAVANKIKEQGTTWKQKGGSDLLEILNSNEVTNKINEIVGEVFTITSKQLITRQLQNV
ncbi:hypothetical protein PFY12_14460 [Chryseobacterium camelliae]|uniref:Uncharacterized protein n=1 Tax=Chryseobacterium camelliae TaxID=1265445 RepID=A0ABY7QKP1_9FLAO|nr:hypothetical protein [Chryseobacterium camelliae]WBV60227.1 hypothetical protein PFY12_14460 [Chryseobacterium camelliae]